jgi:hypothetical protein
MIGNQPNRFEDKIDLVGFGRDYFLNGSIGTGSLTIERDTLLGQYEGVPMVDVAPYIIVDNQKITPIGWSPRSGSVSDGRKGFEADPFGVVDRVTISREAREKSRWHESQHRMASPFPQTGQINR